MPVAARIQCIVKGREVPTSVKYNDNTSVAFYIPSIILDDNVYFDAHSFTLDNDLLANSYIDNDDDFLTHSLLKIILFIMMLSPLPLPCRWRSLRY